MEKSVPVLEDLPPVEGRNVLVRTDFNVPMADGRITDDLRIRLPLETLTWLLDQGAARVTTASHLGPAQGQARTRPSTMEPVRERLTSCWWRQAPTPIGSTCAENLRFDPREEAGDLSFAEELVAGPGPLCQRRLRRRPPGPCVDCRSAPPAAVGRGPGPGPRGRRCSDGSAPRRRAARSWRCWAGPR